MEQRPLIVVAERSETAEEGPRLMDLAVACYRLRWPFLLVWVLVTLLSLLFMPVNARDRFNWTLVVHVMDPPQPAAPLVGQSTLVPPTNQGLQPLMTEWLAAIAASGGSSVELNYLKVGSGAKAEVLKTGLVATATGDAEQPPQRLEQLRSAAEAWAARESSQWLESQKDVVATARKSRDAIAADRARGSSSGDLASAELALAQAEAASRFPPQYRVSDLQSTRVPANFTAELTRRATVCVAIAVGVVAAMSGWSRLRKAAASR